MRSIKSPALRALAVLVAVLCIPVAASAAFRASGTPSVSISVLGTLGMHIEGTTRELSVVDDGTNVTVRVALRNLGSGIALRDHHMRDTYLQVGRFPNAELTVPRTALRVPTSAPVTANVRGQLKVHGQTRNVTFHYEARRAGNAIRVTGRVTFNMNDFGINVPTYMGITVRPNVDVNVQFAVIEQ